MNVPIMTHSWTSLLYAYTDAAGRPVGCLPQLELSLFTSLIPFFQKDGRLGKGFRTPQVKLCKRTAQKTELNVLWHSTGFPIRFVSFFVSSVSSCAWGYGG
jgi:hypothetical protein